MPSATEDTLQRSQHEAHRMQPTSTPAKQKQTPRRSALCKQQKSRTDELMARAEAIISRLEVDSPFFGKTDQVKRLPVFDSGEVIKGALLGQGEFSVVCQIERFNVPEKCKCAFHGGIPLDDLAIPVTNGANVQQQHDYSGEGIESDSDNFGSFGDDEIVGGEDDEDRGFMKEHCFREGSARYAIKQLKPDRTPEEQSEAIIDLAMEAKFLALLSHSNIIKMRGTGGIPCHPEYFLVLDRLYDTLEERIDIWANEKKRLKGVMGVFGKQKVELKHLFADRLLAALDIARAMKYLHEHNIMYRDLKPENIGFDVRGDAKIFDFGLAKELLPRDMVGPDQYKASGMTGSRRYMSPEVALCKPYGLSADVFSFSILLWEIMSLKVPFAGFNVEKHAEQVIHGGRRPKISNSWPVFLKTLLQSAWSVKPTERASFSRICDLVRGELVAIEGSTSGDMVADRSKHLLDRSHSSRNGGH